MLKYCVFYANSLPFRDEKIQGCPKPEGPGFFYCLGNKKTLREDRTAAERKLPLMRPAAGGESCKAGFFLVSDLTLRFRKEDLGFEFMLNVNPQKCFYNHFQFFLHFLTHPECIKFFHRTAENKLQSIKSRRAHRIKRFPAGSTDNASFRRLKSCKIFTASASHALEHFHSQSVKRHNLDFINPPDQRRRYGLLFQSLHRALRPLVTISLKFLHLMLSIDRQST